MSLPSLARIPKSLLAPSLLALGSVLSLGIAFEAGAVVLLGDLDGNGTVDAADEALFAPLYGLTTSDPGFEPAADTNADGRIDFQDLALFGSEFGEVGGYTDTTPPALLVTLNDIPDDMNDLLVVPPERFEITLQTDASGGSILDLGSLSVTSTESIGAYGPGAELAGLFAVTPTRAVFEIPAGSDLTQTSHYLTVSVRDIAGNEANDVYGFAVRDFAYGAPLANLQTFYVDFGTDRSGTSEIDFVEDLRDYGLSSTADAAIETLMRDRIIQEVVQRANPFYGRNPDGSPGPGDPVNALFTEVLPGGSHSRICIGGSSPLGANFLGASTLDENNLDESSDECGSPPLFGIFPQAIDVIWGSSSAYQAAFSPVDSSLGGTPVGEDPLDATVTAPGFDPGSATAEELARYAEIEDAVDAFSQVVASVLAHEVGHLLGLVAHGDAPGGLYGGTSGGDFDHNVTAGGATPAENFLMNRGGSFSFEQISGRGVEGNPVFRPMGRAYLRDRVALNSDVTELLPPPQLFSVSPPTVSYPMGQQNVQLTFHGDGFAATPTVSLILEGDPTPNPVLSPSFIDAQTVTGLVNKFIHPIGTYDVELRNPDGQTVLLLDGVTIQ